jgi:hypothetical protein
VTTAQEDPDKYLRDSVMIEPLQVSEEFVRLPSDLAYWNSKYADALRQHLLAKLTVEETEAELYGRHRDRLLAAGSKATVNEIDAAVQSDPELHQARLAAIDAEVTKARVHGIVSAVSAKRECLVSLGAQLRQEMENDPVVRARHANANVRG